MDELNISEADLAALKEAEYEIVNEYLDEVADNPDNVTLELIIPRRYIPHIVNGYRSIDDGDIEAIAPLAAFMYQVIAILNQAQ